MSTQQQSPYRRDNHFGKDETDEQRQTGHVEADGTDPAEYLAFQHLSKFTDMVCGRTLATTGEEQELSEPQMYLPKEHETGHGKIEYRQHRHRRRVNEETGYINWGESTSTAVPEVDEETYVLAAESYLRDNGVRRRTAEQWLQYARRLYNDPQLSSTEALAKLIARKRQYDSNRQDPHADATVPE